MNPNDPNNPNPFGNYPVTPLTSLSRPGWVNPLSSGQDYAAITTPAFLSPDAYNPYLYPDGFSFDLRLKYLPYRWPPMALRLLNPLRRLALARQPGDPRSLWLTPRVYVTPQDVTVPIPATNSIQRQIQVAPGSIIWGWSFAVFGAGEIRSFQIGVSDNASNYVIIPTWEIAHEFAPAGTAGTGTGFTPVLLAQPYQVSDGNTLNVQVFNTDTVPRNCQFCIWTAAPANGVNVTGGRVLGAPTGGPQGPYYLPQGKDYGVNPGGGAVVSNKIPGR